MLTSDRVVTYDFDQKLWDKLEFVSEGFEGQPDLISLIKAG